ncbi:chromosomal replication initiator protein DnaA [Tannockella kyphosi]|uniref:chromosomal replication initiator protein DnaA n=1 Tax=Tannockella kyphosi TaxID=2899121 RepID=UPI00201272F3|nr:chromosomal replication initiator protein DnaA [Tannockella kyphosi]
MYNFNEIWQNCLTIMEQKEIVKDKICFDTYFKGSTLESIENNVATLSTLMSFNIDTIMVYKLEIESILSSIVNETIELRVVTEDDYLEEKKASEHKNMPFKDNINIDQTFESFVVGSSNRMAQNAASIVSTNPGANFNPLFLYSNPGLGKTHLLHSIGNYAKKCNSNLVIRYITSKEFVDEIIEGMKYRNLDDIYEKYNQIDILLIDDIQFLFGKEKSSEIFFHIFNNIINNNKQIVITSDKKPEELQGIEDRLISRFQSGLSFGIDPPEFETARAILEKKIENLDNPQLVIQDDVIDFMASNYCNDIRNLEGSLKRLFFCSIMQGINVIDMNFIFDAFRDDNSIKNPTSTVTKDIILKTTADFYYLSVTQLISKNKTQKLTTPREISMFLMRDLLDITFAEIGSTYSGRDHSTIMKACARVEKKMKNDKDYKLAVTKLKEKLGTS